MSEQDKALVRQFVDQVWNKRNLAMIDQLLSGQWVGHDLPAGLASGPEGLKQLAAGFQAAFSETRTSLDDQIAEGEKVAWRWTFRGTHTGEFMGMPPTNKQVVLTGVSIDRIVEGKFVERWDSLDTLGLLQQLGAIPSPG